MQFIQLIIDLCENYIAKLDSLCFTIKTFVNSYKGIRVRSTESDFSIKNYKMFKLT